MTNMRLKARLFVSNIDDRVIDSVDLTTPDFIAILFDPSAMVIGDDPL